MIRFQPAAAEMASFDMPPGERVGWDVKRDRACPLGQETIWQFSLCVCALHVIVIQPLCQGKEGVWHFSPQQAVTHNITTFPFSVAVFFNPALVLGAPSCRAQVGLSFYLDHSLAVSPGPPCGACDCSRWLKELPSTVDWQLITDLPAAASPESVCVRFSLFLFPRPQFHSCPPAALFRAISSPLSQCLPDNDIRRALSKLHFFNRLPQINSDNYSMPL